MSNCAQLLSQPQRIGLNPGLDDLAVPDAVDDDARPGDLLAGRLSAKEEILVGAATGPSRDDGIPLGDLFLDGHVEVGYAAANGRGKLLDALRPIGVPCTRIDAAIIYGKQFVNDIQIALVVDLFYETSDDGIV